MLTFLITLLATALLFLGQSDGRIATTIYSALGIASAQAAGGKVEGPNVVAPDRYVYYPGTEKVDRKEIRLTACGTWNSATATRSSSISAPARWITSRPT
jgi:hypothetical protein